MRLITGILLAVFISAVFPACAAAWGSPIDSQAGIWNVKKPYNSGWGHCACSGGICGLSYTSGAAVNLDSINSQVSFTGYQQTNYSAGKASVAYLVPTGVIDCTKDTAKKIQTIDCTNSTTSDSAGYSYIYSQGTTACQTGWTCPR